MLKKVQDLGRVPDLRNLASRGALSEDTLHDAGNKRMITHRPAVYQRQSHRNRRTVKVDGAVLQLQAV